MNKKHLRYGLSVFVALLLSGCATYHQGVQGGLTRMEAGDYKGSISSFQKSLDPAGNDRLLHHMELGLLHHLDGNYRKSNDYLDKAAIIAEKLFTTSITDAVIAGVTNPRNGPYRGADFEKVFIHYYKSLNYLFLDRQDGTDVASSLEAAAIEARKVDILLADIRSQRGSYDERQSQKESKFLNIKKIFSGLYSGVHMTDDLVYREDAYLRYLSGVVYEANDLLDDARISYQKAAELYEQGFSKQYGLGKGVAEQAWFDALRVMKKIGGFNDRISKLSKSKLSATKRKELDSIGMEKVPVFVIQHLGKVQQREELDLQLTLHPREKNLVIKPVYSGTEQVQRDQYAWFTALYSGRGLLDVVYNYHSGNLFRAAEGLWTKTIPVAPVWPVIEQMKLDESLVGFGVRVTVPYYPPLRSKFAASTLMVDGKGAGAMVAASAISELALQEQLLNANSELIEALTRAILKSYLAKETGKQLGLGEFSGLAGSLLAGATSAAETRNWLTLPEQVRIKRLMLNPGKHIIKIKTKMKGGAKDKIHLREIEVGAKKLNIFKLRTTAWHQTESGSASAARFKTAKHR